MSDKPRDYCGIFGIADHPEAALLSYYGLHSLQHRGQNRLEFQPRILTRRKSVM